MSAPTHRYQAVLFDLLTALVDSWSLWNSVAGAPDSGRKWRGEYLRLTYGCGRYQPYEQLVADAAQSVGLPRDRAAELAARYGEIAPWPEASETLHMLHQAGVMLGIVTNCSESLGQLAADRLATPFRVIVTAERAGYYKPDPRPYQLALSELGIEPRHCLFVAGSGYDLFGAARAGLPAWWHNRIEMAAPPDAPPPIAHHRTLSPLVADVLTCR